MDDAWLCPCPFHRANNDGAGRFAIQIYGRGGVYGHGGSGRRFLSLRKPLASLAATGERAGGTHLPFSVLTAAQQGSLNLSLSLSRCHRHPRVPSSPFRQSHAPVRFPLPLPFSIPRSRLSRLPRCTDVAIRLRETRARDIAPQLRQRIRQRIVFCVTCYAMVARCRRPPRSRHRMYPDPPSLPPPPAVVSRLL